MNIIIEDKQNLITVPEEFFYEISKIILEGEGKGLNFEISFLLLNNQEMKELNATYRNIDQPTDVLSFPMWEENDIPLPDIDNLLGDIVISTDKVIEQSKDHGHSHKREIAMLVIHGILHLFHYDHMEDDDEEKMREKEKLYLDKVISLLNI
ncbi:MAG: rRNA maturation RNase YbeY [Candidatus Eremiobacterota bacterium]